MECLKKCGMARLEWLVTLSNVSFNTWVLQGVVHVPCPCTKGRATNVKAATQEVVVCSVY